MNTSYGREDRELFAIGIPTFNEAGNIADLVKKIDDAAQALNLDVVIINADSASTDDTGKLFLDTITKNQKVSLSNSEKGKGRNIRSIVKHVASNDIEGCILVDGDIRSFDCNWLKQQVRMLTEGNDYVVPVYARNFQEGNTTNHFVYPLLGMHLEGKAPRQPIAGDFGLSLRFAKYLNDLDWHRFALGYGVDVFMTLHAMYGDFRLTEVELGRKIHNPSFNKMIPMFHEVAASYYETIRYFANKPILGRQRLISGASRLIETGRMSHAAIAKRKEEALVTYIAGKTVIPDCHLQESMQVTKELWTRIIISHEKEIFATDSEQLAASIVPWFLMRVTHYLENFQTATRAAQEIDDQFLMIVKQWTDEADSHASRSNRG